MESAPSDSPLVEIRVGQIDHQCQAVGRERGVIASSSPVRHCRHAARAAGAEPDDNRFRGHLTMARAGQRSDVREYLERQDPPTGHAWIADRVELVESRLGAAPGGRPAYETLETFPLGARRSRGPRLPPPSEHAWTFVGGSGPDAGVGEVEAAGGVEGIFVGSGG